MVSLLGTIDWLQVQGWMWLLEDEQGFFLQLERNCVTKDGGEGEGRALEGVYV